MSLSGTSLATRGFVTTSGSGAGGAISTGTLAGKPEAYFVVPEVAFLGLASIARVTSEQGAYPGSVVPSSGNLGTLFPLQSGTLQEGAVDHTYQVLESAGSETVEWAWKLDTDSDTAWRGTNDPRLFYQGHDPTAGVAPGSENGAVAYSSLHRRVLCFNIDDSTNVVTIFYRDQDDARLDEWTSTTFTLESDVSAGHNNLRVVELDDGVLCMAVRSTLPPGLYASTPDFDIYHSTDGGLTWARVAQWVRSRRSNQDNATAIQDGSTAKQFAFTRSGDYLRIDWINIDVNKKLQSMVSADRGMTWKFVDDAGLLTYDDGGADSPGVMNVVDVDGRGTFLVSFASTSTVVTHADAFADAAYVAISGGGFTSTQVIKSMAMVKALGWIWQFYERDDAGVGPDQAWVLRRVRSENYETGSSWQEVDQTWPKSGNLYVASRLDLVWTGDALVFWCANKNIGTNVEVQDASLWYALGWTQRSLGIMGPGTPSIATGSATPGGSVYIDLWSESWDPRQGEPSAPTGSNWTLVQTGGSTTMDLSKAEIATTGAGQTRYYEVTDTAVLVWWAGNTAQGRGSCFEFELALDPGDSTTASDDVAVNIRALNGLGSYVDVSIRVGPTGVAIRDNVLGATADTITADLDNGRYWTFRWFMGAGAGLQGQLAIRDSAVGSAWQVSNLITFGATGGGSNRLQFGHLGQAAGGTMTSRWRRMSISNIDQLRQGSPYNKSDFPGATYGFVNPDYLLGMSSGLSSPIEVEGGLEVAWAGLGGAEGDSFTGETDHSYAAENVWEDSPRIMWRSNGLPSNLVLEPDDFNASGWTLFNCSAADDSITDPFGVATNATQITFAEVPSGNRLFARFVGSTDDPTNTTAPYRGYTLSFWLRVDGTSADTVTLGFDVSDGPGSVSTGAIAADGIWRRYELYVQRNGTGGSIGFMDLSVVGYAGSSTSLVFSVFDVKLTRQTEIIFQHNGESSELRETLDTLALLNTNFRRCLIDEDTDINFGSPSSSTLVDAARYGTETNQWVVAGTGGRAVTFSDSVSPGPQDEPDGIMTELYLRPTVGERSLETYKVSRHRKVDGTHLAHLDDMTQDAASEGFATDDEVVIFGPTAISEFTPMTAATYFRVRILDAQTAEGWYQIGGVVLGLRKTLDVPMDWSFTDNEQGNTTVHRTRGSVSWAFEEGPPQRSIQGRIIGDVQAWREELRLIQRELGYEVRPLVLVLDEDFANESMIYGRITSGNQRDEVAWYIDATSTNRTAGDLSLTFLEEV